LQGGFAAFGVEASPLENIRDKELLDIENIDSLF